MKKLANVIALFILVSVDVLTPISYAQESLDVTEEISPVVVSEDEGELGESDLTVWGAYSQELDEEGPSSDDVVGEEILEDLPEVLDDVPSLIDMVVDTVLEDIDKSFDNEVEEEEEGEDGVSDSMLFVGNVDEPQIKVAANGDSITSGCYTYTIIDGENKQIEITQYSGNSNCPKFIDLSNGIDGYDVISIGYRAFYEKGITGVVLGNTVEYVGEQAFLDWNAQLKLLNIGQNVRYLGYDAFHLYYYVGDNAYYTDVKFEEGFNIADLQISGGQYNRNWFIIKGGERGCFLFDVQKNEINGYLCDDAIIIVPEEIYGLTVKSIYGYRGNGQGGAFSNTSSRLAILPPTIDNIGAAAACPYVSGIASVEDVSELEVQGENDLSLGNHYVGIKPYTGGELSQLITNEMLSDACMYISEEHIVRFYDEDGKFIKAITVEGYIDNEDYPEVNDKDGLHGKRFDSDGKLYQGEPIISDLNLKLGYVGVIHHEDLGIIEVHGFNDTMYIKDKNEGAVNLWDAGNYYFWGNNKGVNSVDLQESSSYNYTYGGREIVNMSDLDEGFLEGGKMSERNTGWEEGKTNNPCDVNKGEYLPTPEDWVNLMNIWANMNGDILDDARNREGRYEVSSLGTLTGTIGFRNYGSYFNEDMLIPYVQHLSLKSGKLWKIYGSMLWTSRDGLGSIGGYYVSEGELGRSNSYLDGEAYPVRCFVAEPVTVTFDFGDDVIVKNVFKGKTIERLGSTPTKAGYTLEGWYTQAGTKWNFDQDRVEGNMTLYAKWRVCGEGFTVKNNKCIPNDMDMNGIIEVSDGEDTMYIKDRNVGSENECVNVTMINNYVRDTINSCLSICGTEEYCGTDYCINNASGEIIEYANNIVGEDFEDIESVESYCNNTNMNCGNYYFRGNNNGVRYDELIIDEDSGEITNMSQLDSKFLEGGKLGNEEGSGWIEGNTNNPCNGEREYLPTPEDWVNLINIWANKNGYDLDNYDLDNDFDDGGLVNGPQLGEYSLRALAMESAGMFEFPNPGYADQFLQDMLIPYAGMITYDYSSCATDEESNCGELYFRNGWPILWAAQDKNGYVGLFNGDGVFYGEAQNMVDERINDVAAPVRCFVNVPDVLVITLESDGRVYKELNVVKGNTLVEPTAPSKSNATFDGWYTENGDKYDFDTPFTEDMTLYAKWTENKGNGYSGGGSSSKPTKTEPVDKHNSADEKKAEPEIKKEEGKNIKIITDAPVNTEKETFNAHQWAYSKGLTKYRTPSEARMDDFLNRSEMAKISSIFAMEFLDKTPNLDKKEFCSQYSDMWKVEDDMKFFITESCELGYMGYESNGIDALERFRPYTPLTVAETATILSRIVWGHENAMNGKDWYKGHLYATYNHGLIDDIKDPTTRSITRKEAYTMLYRLVNMVE